MREHVPRPYARFERKTGLAPGRLQGYMRGEVPPPEALAAIARELHISVDEIFSALEYSPPAALPPSAVPIVGWVAAGLPAPGPAPAPQKAVLEIAGLRVTIIVELMR